MDAIRECAMEAVSDLECQARFANSSGSGQGEEAAFRGVEVLDDSPQLMFTPEQRSDRRGQAGGSGRRRCCGASEGNHKRQICLKGIDCLFLPGHAQKEIALFPRDFQVLGEQLGDLARGAASIRFDLEDQGDRAPHPLRQLVLRQVERLAPAFDPGSKGMIHDK
jgi:hypothetical protein